MNPSYLEITELFPLATFISENEMSIDMLDDDCLEKIFMYIPHESRIKLERVCKKWKRASQHAWYDLKKLDFGDEKWLLKKKKRHQYSAPNLIEKITMFKRCGRYLQELNLSDVITNSLIMPLIKKYSPNLIKLELQINNWKEKHFINIFDNMKKLESLIITFEPFEYSIPIRFIEALLSIADTLKVLRLSNNCYDMSRRSELSLQEILLPQQLIPVFKQLKLQTLSIINYKFEKDIIEAISQIHSLVNLQLTKDWESYDETNIYPISNMKNLEKVILGSCFDNNDELLVNLADNSKNLKYLNMNVCVATDIGLKSLTYLNNFEVLIMTRKDDGYCVTDASIGRFKNLKYLDCSFCKNVSNYSVIKVIKNSPNLEKLKVICTDVTEETIKQAASLTRIRNNNVTLILDVCLDGIPMELSEIPEYSSPNLIVNNHFYYEKPII